MYATLTFILSLSVAVAVIIAIARWRVIDPVYYPFIYNLVISLAVELINGAHKYSLSTIRLLNVFSIIEFSLFAWLFHNWGLFNNNRRWFTFTLLLFIGAWAYITFVVTGFNNINNGFLILYSLALIFFAVTAFNKIVIQQRINIFTNAKFWICIGIIIFYSFFVLTRATELPSGLHFSNSFKHNLQQIISYSNAFVNLLYAVAVIWIPRKKNITTLY